MPVKTRSMIKEIAMKCSTSVKFDIDFDESSRAWRQNKNILPNGCFTYKDKDPTSISTKSVKNKKSTKE